MEIPLNKSPESPEEREALIGGIIKEQEQIFAQSIGYIQRMVIDKLLELGYKLSEIEINKSYHVIVSDREEFTTYVDIMVTVDGKTIMAIKCTPTSIDSWQRFMFAFCRVVEPYQIPYAFITDGQDGRLINILSGEVIETPQIPSRQELLDKLSNVEFVSYDREKLPKERRILYAFDAIKCCPTCNT